MKITNVDYYLDTMKKLYPEVSKADLKRILNYGWRQFYLINSYGGDICTSDESGFWMYSGYLTKDSFKHFNRYRSKLIIRIRTLYKRKKFKWDGFYYFALSEEEYQKLQAQKKTRGRPRKSYNYGDVMLYKILDECKVKEFYKQYIFKVPYITDIGFKKKRENYITGEAELIIQRPPQKIKDILVENKIYDVLNG